MHGITSQTFAPEDLESLDHVFKTAWAMLVAAAPSQNQPAIPLIHNTEGVCSACTPVDSDIPKRIQRLIFDGLKVFNSFSTCCAQAVNITAGKPPSVHASTGQAKDDEKTSSQ
jgi:hypothetical protein